MPVEISDWDDLDAVRNDLAGDYILINDLDSETDGYAGIGDDFQPIGFVDDDTRSEFTGSFDGDGFEIKDLLIEFDQLSTGDIGLFALLAEEGTIKNLIVDGSVTVTNSDVDDVGGMIGRTESGDGKIENCGSHIDVTAPDARRVGVLGGNTRIQVTRCYTAGSVEADEFVGGLFGLLTNPNPTDNYAVSSVEGRDNVGGCFGGTNESSHNTSYAAGAVVADEDAGGYTASDDDKGEFTDTYWDTEATGQDTSDGDSEPLTTSEMQGANAETNLEGFDFADTWETVLESDEDVSEDGYPILSSLDRERQLEAQGIFDGIEPPEPPSNLTAELL